MLLFASQQFVSFTLTHSFHYLHILLFNKMRIIPIWYWVTCAHGDWQVRTFHPAQLHHLYTLADWRSRYSCEQLITIHYHVRVISRSRFSCLISLITPSPVTFNHQVNANQQRLNHSQEKSVCQAVTFIHLLTFSLPKRGKCSRFAMWWVGGNQNVIQSFTLKKRLNDSEIPSPCWCACVSVQVRAFFLSLSLPSRLYR